MGPRKSVSPPIPNTPPPPSPPPPPLPLPPAPSPISSLLYRHHRCCQLLAPARSVTASSTSPPHRRLHHQHRYHHHYTGTTSTAGYRCQRALLSPLPPPPPPPVSRPRRHGQSSASAPAPTPTPPPTTPLAERQGRGVDVGGQASLRVGDSSPWAGDSRDKVSAPALENPVFSFILFPPSRTLSAGFPFILTGGKRRRGQEF